MDFKFHLLNPPLGTALPTSVAVAPYTQPITTVPAAPGWVTVHTPLPTLSPVAPVELSVVAEVAALQAELVAIKEELTKALQAVVAAPAAEPEKPAVPLRALRHQRQAVGLFTLVP